MANRLPQVAGSFYSANAHKLQEQIESCFLSDLGPKKLPSQVAKEEKNRLLGIIVPHAGYVYSGPIASWAYLEAAKEIRALKTAILLGPNHTGSGAPVAIYPEGSWSTPFGSLTVNRNLSHRLAEEGFSIDELAHSFEHSLEVQLPFLQFLYGNSFQIVAVTMLDQSLKTAIKLGENLARVLEQEKEFLIIATTDLTHYESEEEAHNKDEKLLETLQKGDVANVYKTASNLQVSACGIGPAAAAIKACSLLKANKINLLKYETSAAITHDKQAVVGYASLSLCRQA